MVRLMPALSPMSDAEGKRANLRGGRDGNTHARVVQCIRRRCNTVRDIAAALDLTENAVRFHIASLSRAGMIRRSGVIRAGHVGKPPLAYELTDAAEQIQSRAYAPVLAVFVEDLRERVPVKQLRRIMRSVGSRLAAELPQPTGTFATRVRRAAAVLEVLGGAMAVRRAADGVVIEGHGCPLALVVTREPATCAIVQGVLHELVHARVTELCDHTARPRCRFLIRQSDAA